MNEDFLQPKRQQHTVGRELPPADDIFWLQATSAIIATAETVVQVRDSSPSADRWNFVAVEIVAGEPG